MSRKLSLRYVVLLLFAVTLLLAACRRGEEEATPTEAATAVVATPTLADTAESDETDTQATATAVPTAETADAEPIDPDAIDWQPQLLFSEPAPGSELALDHPITVRFDQPMDQASVESAFTLAAVGSGVRGSFDWPRPDTLVFTPGGRLQRNQSYQLKISEAAKGRNGLALESPLSLNYQSVGFLDVSQVIPAPDTDGIQTEAAITVVFNRPVAPLVATGQQAELPQPLTISPEVAGQGEWVTTSIYRFTPDEPLAGASTYEVTVASGLESIGGGVLEAPFSWQFTTLAPRVVTVQPENNRRNVAPTQPITLTFNMPMDMASTEAAIDVRGEDAPAVAVDYQWSDDNQVVALQPQQQLQLETTYQVVVGQAATSANGDATLAEPFVSTFTTVPFPAVLGTQPADGATADQWQRGFSVRFASPMDPDTLEGRLRIEPEPERVRYFYNQFEDQFEMFVDFELVLNADYRVTIPAAAADPYGNTLAEPYTFSFQAPSAMPVASFNLPGQVSQLSASFPTEVGLIHRNVGQATVSLTDLGLPLNLLTQPFEIQDYRPAASPLRIWDLQFDTPRDQADLAALPLAEGETLPNGVYLLRLDSPDMPEDAQFWQTQRVLLIMADTNIVVKEMFGEIHAWATDISSGEPAADRDLTLYNQRGAELGTAVTDDNGYARINYSRANDRLEGILVVSGRPGQPGFGATYTNWSAGFNPWEQGVELSFSDEAPTYAYIYTDRPIYRPGDTMYFKGILREANYGRYRLPDQESINLSLAPNFFVESGGFEDSFTVDVNPDGTFTGEYTLPEDVSLGDYRLAVNRQEVFADRTFSIAEYRTPEFLVNMTPSVSETLRGEPAQVVLDADFLFGGSAAGLQVNWDVYQDVYRPDVEGPFYFFSDNADFFYEPNPFFLGAGGGAFGQFVTSGQGETDENGRLVINLPADLLQDADPGSRKVTVQASVSDLANFPVSSRTSVIFHAAESYVGVIPGDYIATAGADVSVDLVTVDWDGQPVPEQDVEVVFYRREWTPVRNSEFGMYFTQWEAEDTEVDRAQVTTDAQGEAQASFTPEDGGSYIAVATVTDDGGRTHTSSAYIWVADPDFTGWQVNPRDSSMDLTPDRTSYQVGDTAQVLVQLPFEQPVQAWLTIERGTMIDQRVITLDGGGQVIEIPIEPSYAPNVHVTVAAVKPVNPDDADNPYADIRVGVTGLDVSPERLELDVELTPQTDVLAPGETAVYDIRVTDYRGQPVQAELSLALVDLAVLLLKPDNAPHILEAFYSPQPLRSQVGAGLFISGEGLEPEIPLQGGGLGGGGGFATAAEALRAAVDEEEGVRRDFPDTAYWRAIVETDENGEATVEIPLPDSATTWRLSSKAVTEDTLIGQASVDVVVTLPLLVRPVTPRFFTVGDDVAIGAIVNNNTDQAIEATVSLEAEGLALHDDGAQTVTVPANGRQLVRWSTTVNDVAFVDLTFRAEGGEYSDATKPTFGVGPNNEIPVYRYTGEDIVATAGVLDETGRRVEAVLLPEGVDTRQGSVDVEMNPSLAAALIDALEATHELDWEPQCASSVVDRLLSNVATATAIDELGLARADLQATLDERITTEISQLQRLVKSDGGWGWCFSPESDPWLSAYAVLGLTKAEAAGYDVDSDVLDDGIAYVERQIRDPERLNNAWEVNRQAFFLYVLAESGSPVSGDVDALVEEHRALLDPYAKALLALAYELDGESGSNHQEALLADLNDSAVLSATGNHWEDESRDFRNLNSDVRGTAMVIDALARIDPDNPLAAPAVRWLMVARDAQIWSTGHETAWSIFALTDWMAATGELDADYGYSLAVNGKSEARGEFTAANITESEQVLLPLRQLLAGEPNYLDFKRGEGNGRLYYSVHLDSHIDVSLIQPVDRGFTVKRTYYDAACDPETEECRPIESIQAGDQVRVELTIVVPNDRVFAVVEDPIPAGAEGIDPALETSDLTLTGRAKRVGEEYRFGYWGWWFFNRIEYRDEKVVFFARFLPAGTYQYTYFLQTNIPGKYQVRPTTAKEDFFPEVFGRSEGMIFTITE